MTRTINHNYNTSNNIFNLWFDYTELFQKLISRIYFKIMFHAKEIMFTLYTDHTLKKFQ